MVNDVATVVHEAVCLNHGAPNKNIGDAFLVRATHTAPSLSAASIAAFALELHATCGTAL